MFFLFTFNTLLRLIVSKMIEKKNLSLCIHIIYTLKSKCKNEITANLIANSTDHAQNQKYKFPLKTNSFSIIKKCIYVVYVNDKLYYKL